jgi:ABC-type molybdate transport system substrate-binding protein
MICVRQAVAAMATVFEKQTGHKVKTTVAAPGEIVPALQAGGQADVVVVTNGASAELEDKGLAKNMIPSGRFAGMGPSRVPSQAVASRTLSST